MCLSLSADLNISEMYIDNCLSVNNDVVLFKDRFCSGLNAVPKLNIRLNLARHWKGPVK